MQTQVAVEGQAVSSLLPEVPVAEMGFSRLVDRQRRPKTEVSKA